MKKKYKETEYSKKLRDPRWQKKRLEIMERDEFTCVNCGDSESTLNVHHCYYVQGRNPWEYENRSLLTLCEECHQYETDSLFGVREQMSRSFGMQGFLSNEILSVAIGLAQAEIRTTNYYFSSALEWALQDREIQDSIIRAYSNHIKSINGEDVE